MHPEQALIRDADGNLPIHIITSSKEKSDVETFLCCDCCLIKSKLVNIQYHNNDTEYCCEHCFKSKSGDLMSKAYYISPVQKVLGVVQELVTIAPEMLLDQNSKGYFSIHLAFNNQQSYDTLTCFLKRPLK